MDTIEIRSMIKRKKLDASGFSQLEDRELSFAELCQKFGRGIMHSMKGYYVLLRRKLGDNEINYEVN